MQVASNINFKKLLITATIVVAFLLALTSIVPSIADSIKSNANGGDVDITATKTAQWTDEEYTKGNVQITAKATGKNEFTPNVLFIGTLCSAHGLKPQTIVKSLNAIKEFCNVDYFLCHNADPERTGLDTKGTINKGAADVTTEIVPSMVTSDHQALQKFLRHIYEEHSNMVKKTGKGYDFIVLEFDGTRISDWYRSLIPDNDQDPRRPSGDYTKYVNEENVAEVLKTYYANNQVIWITDSVVDTSVPESGYHPSTAMNVRTQDLNTRAINFNSLKALLAPSLYVKTTEHEGMTDEEYRKIEAGLSTDPFDADHTLGFDRQIGYDSSSAVGGFLKEAIDSIFEYQIVIKDKIDLKENLKINDDSVVFEMREKDTDKWIAVPDEMKPVVAVNSKTGDVSASVSKLRGDKQFRVTIDFEDKSSTERFIDVSKYGNPNDGSAEVEIIPGTGVIPEPATPETEKPLDWEVPIYYVVEDAYKTDSRVSIDNDEDKISTSSTKSPNGSEASTKEASVQFQYWSTIIDGKDTFVSNDFKYVPKPDSTTKRYQTKTYIAHFAEVPSETKKLTVEKIWSDGDDFHLNDQITVHLYADNLDLGSFTMDAQSNWKYTTKYEYQIINDATGLPIKYTFKEDAVEGYEASYVVDESDPKTSGNTVITNTYVPGPEPTPTPDPGPVVPINNNLTQTGDIVNFISLLIVAIIGTSLLAIFTRSKRKSDKKRG